MAKFHKLRSQMCVVPSNFLAIHNRLNKRAFCLKGRYEVKHVEEFEANIT